MWCSKWRILFCLLAFLGLSFKDSSNDKSLRYFLYKFYSKFIIRVILFLPIISRISEVITTNNLVQFTLFEKFVLFTQSTAIFILFEYFKTKRLDLDVIKFCKILRGRAWNFSRNRLSWDSFLILNNSLFLCVLQLTSLYANRNSYK